MIIIPIWLSMATTKPECRPVAQSKNSHGTTSATMGIAIQSQWRRARPKTPPPTAERAVATEPAFTCRASPSAHAA